MGEPNAMDEVVPIFHSRDNVDESKPISLFVASINSLLQLDLTYVYTAVRQSCKCLYVILFCVLHYLIMSGYSRSVILGVFFAFSLQ